MKRELFLSVIICLSIISPAKAVVFDNSGYHLINYAISEDIWVDQSVSNNPGTEIEFVTGGSATDDVQAYNYGTVTVSGGSISGELCPDDNATVTITGGVICDVMAFGSSAVTISGGSIQNNLAVGNYSTATVSGGTVGNHLHTHLNGTMNLVGSGFAVDGNSVNYGDNLRDYGTVGLDALGYSCLLGTVTGLLSDGSSLNNNFYIHNDSDIYVVPEPATLLLLGLGAIILRRKH